MAVSYWNKGNMPKGDSNTHELLHTPLKRARLRWLANAPLSWSSSSVLIQVHRTGLTITSTVFGLPPVITG